jgi:hypothetical protein
VRQPLAAVLVEHDADFVETPKCSLIEASCLARADFPPEQYAYRPRRNAQQAVVEVEALPFRGHPEVAGMM